MKLEFLAPTERDIVAGGLTTCRGSTPRQVTGPAPLAMTSSSPATRYAAGASPRVVTGQVVARKKLDFMGLHWDFMEFHWEFHGISLDILGYNWD